VEWGYGLGCGWISTFITALWDCRHVGAVCITWSGKPAIIMAMCTNLPHCWSCRNGRICVLGYSLVTLVLKAVVCLRVLFSPLLPLMLHLLSSRPAVAPCRRPASCRPPGSTSPPLPPPWWHKHHADGSAQQHRECMAAAAAAVMPSSAAAGSTVPCGGSSSTLAAAYCGVCTVPRRCSWL